MVGQPPGPPGTDLPRGRGAREARETWRDWLPPGLDDPGPLLSRPELIARLRAVGIAASSADLRYWEYEGILPRAVREGRGGKARALYPEWYVYLVAQLRALQRDGYDLAAIRGILHTLSGGRPDPEATAVPRPGWLDAIGYAPAPPGLPDTLAELARRLERTHPDSHPMYAELRLVTPGGAAFTYLLPLSISESEDTDSS